MPRPAINFFSEGISFKLRQKGILRKWIAETIKLENFKLTELNFIFCDDTYLLALNQQYLNHDTLTDIITFDNSEGTGSIVGDIFISIERIHENAGAFKVTFSEELHRIMIHGTLHLLGYPDKGKVAKAAMTAKENFYLTKLSAV